MSRHQNGAAITEFIIIAPLVIFISMVGLQFGLMYIARLHFTYAAYEAARAGAINNADPVKIQAALYKALIPYYATSGINIGETHIASLIPKNPNIVEVAAKGVLMKEVIQRTESAFIGIHMVNPSKASFDDFNDTNLQRVFGVKNHLNNPPRIIPNDELGAKDSAIGAKSKQSIQDANVLKLRITFGYEPKVPMMKNVFSAVTAFFGSQRDAVSARILAAGRIPIVVDVSSQMLTPPIEGGLPSTTVNRSGFLIGSDLVDRLVADKSLQWQVGYQKDDILSGVTDSLTANALQSVESTIDQGSYSNIGTAVVDSAKQTIGNLIMTNGQTGKSNDGMSALIGDMNGLVSCSSGTPVANFY